MTQSFQRLLAKSITLALISGFLASIGTAQSSITFSAGSGFVPSGTYLDVNINGAAVYELTTGVIANDDLSVSANGQAIVSGATITDAFSASGSGQITFNSGSALRGFVSGDAIFTLNGGTITNSILAGGATLNMNGGSAGSVGVGTSTGTGAVNFTGGTLSSGISAEWNSTVTISGGNPTRVNLQRGSNLILQAFDFGSGYSSGQVLTFSDLGADPEGATNVNGLAFTLNYGGGNIETFNVRGFNSSPLLWNGTITLTAVPEPATAPLILAGIVMAAVVGRRRPRALAKS